MVGGYYIRGLLKGCVRGGLFPWQLWPWLYDPSHHRDGKDVVGGYYIGGACLKGVSGCVRGVLDGCLALALRTFAFGVLKAY